MPLERVSIQYFCIVNLEVPVDGRLHLPAIWGRGKGARSHKTQKEGLGSVQLLVEGIHYYSFCFHQLNIVTFL